jgi:hypothetical protein
MTHRRSTNPRADLLAKLTAYREWERKVREEWNKATRAGMAQPDDETLFKLINECPGKPEGTDSHE